MTDKAPVLVIDRSNRYQYGTTHVLDYTPCAPGCNASHWIDVNVKDAAARRVAIVAAAS